MKNIDDYRIFFELEAKYPQHCDLIGDLIRYKFTHNDSLIGEKYIYLDDVYFEEDIKLVFQELHLPEIEYILCSPTRSKPFVMLRLK